VDELLTAVRDADVSVVGAGNDDFHLALWCAYQLHYSGFDGVDDRWVLSAGLEALDARARRIVELRFFQERTQSQIAAELGISQMHVSRLLRDAMQRMRTSIEAHGGVR